MSVTERHCHRVRDSHAQVLTVGPSTSPCSKSFRRHPGPDSLVLAPLECLLVRLLLFRAGERKCLFQFQPPPHYPNQKADL